MRIKTIPRHRLVQRSAKVASVAKTSSDEEAAVDTEKDYDSIYTINSQNSYQIYQSPSTILIPITVSTTSNSDLTLSSSTNTSPSLTNDDNNNMVVKRDTVSQKARISIGDKEEKEKWRKEGDEEREANTGAVNLSTKDNRVGKTAADAVAVEPEDKLKDTFLYKIMTDPNFLENIQRSKQPKKFVCLFCKEDFKTCEELTNHMDVKRNESNQIVCCACKKTFAEKRYLKYHRRCHSERTKFTCDICTRKYTRLDNLTRHNVLHVNPDKFSCTICNRTFTRKDLLNKHRKSHEKYNLYCEKCGKYFRRILTLENHQKTHGQISNVSMNSAVDVIRNSAKNISFSAENAVCETANLTNKNHNFSSSNEGIC